MDDRSSDWPRAVRPWQAASIALGTLEAIAVVAALALSISGHTAALGACSVVVALALARWMLEEVALRRLPAVDFASLYADSPLDRRQRALVAASLAATPILILLLFIVVPSAGVVGLVVSAVTTVPRLSRVWRRNSWLAISRLPMEPRRSMQQTG
jgi:hypothetical protein